MNNYEQLMAKLGQNVKTFRLEKELSLDEVSLEIGVSVKCLKKLENGQDVRITLLHLDRFRKIFNLSSVYKLFY